jgi:hypothetical protein
LKLTDLIQLEHETGEVVPVSLEEVSRWLAASQQLQHTTAGSSESLKQAGNLALFKHEIDAQHHAIILTALEDHQQPVGYVLLQQKDGRWQVLSLWLQPRLRGGGLITNVYRALASAGHKLQSGASLSPSAEKVWQRLGQLGVAKVLDTQTNKIEDFSDKPIGDGDLAAGVEPCFFWVTEGHWLTVTHAGGASALKEGLAEWLLRGQKGSTKVLGMSSFVVEAQE